MKAARVVAVEWPPTLYSLMTPFGSEGALQVSLIVDDLGLTKTAFTYSTTPGSEDTTQCWSSGSLGEGRIGGEGEDFWSWTTWASPKLHSDTPRPQDLRTRLNVGHLVGWGREGLEEGEGVGSGRGRLGPHQHCIQILDSMLVIWLVGGGEGEVGEEGGGEGCVWATEAIKAHAKTFCSLRRWQWAVLRVSFPKMSRKRHVNRSNQSPSRSPPKIKKTVCTKKWLTVFPSPCRYHGADTHVDTHRERVGGERLQVIHHKGSKTGCNDYGLVWPGRADLPTKDPQETR